MQRRSLVTAGLSLAVGFWAAWWVSRAKDLSTPLSNTKITSKGSSQNPNVLNESDTPQARSMNSSFPTPGLAPIGKIFLGPNDPGYLAADVVASGVRRPGELFGREPRDVVWASQRELSLGTFPEREIRLADPEATVEVECRRTMCRVRITSTSPFLTSQFGSFPYSCGGALVMGDLELSDESGKRYADLYVMFHGDSLDEATFNAHNAAWCTSGRTTFLDSLKNPFSYE